MKYEYQKVVKKAIGSGFSATSEVVYHVERGDEHARVVLGEEKVLIRRYVATFHAGGEVLDRLHILEICDRQCVSTKLTTNARSRFILC